MLVSFSWQGYLDFSLFTLHFSLQQLTWYRLNYLTTDYLTTSESRVIYYMLLSKTFVKMGGFCKLVELIQVSGIEYLSSSSQQMLLSVFL